MVEKNGVVQCQRGRGKNGVVQCQRGRGKKRHGTVRGVHKHAEVRPGRKDDVKVMPFCIKRDQVEDEVDDGERDSNP